MEVTRDNNFDFTRLALAIAVIFSHSYVLTGGPGGRDPLHELTGGRAEFGVLAVNGFFAISGFLIAASWIRSRTTVSYFRKRLHRIYPGFIVACLIGAFVVAPLASEALRYEGWAKQLAGLILLKNVEPSGAFAANPYPTIVNGSLWTIAYEFRCYLLVALLGLAGLLTRRAVLLVLTVASATLYAAAHYIELPQTSGVVSVVFGQPERLARLFTYFLLGSVLYVAKVPLRGSWAALAAIVGVASLFHPALGRGVFPAAFTYALLWFCTTPVVRLRGWARHGDFSYGTYLYAFPIQQALVQLTDNRLSALVHFGLAAVLSVAAGFVSWHGVERQFLRWVGPRSARRGEDRSQPPTVGAEAWTDRDRGRAGRFFRGWLRGDA